jgi:uncharacterized membrane protein YqjE
MWQTAAKLLVFFFLRNRANHAKHDLTQVQENLAVLAENRAAIFKKNFNDELQRMANSLMGLIFLLLAATCSGLTGIMWLFATAWNSSHRNMILGVTMVVPILIAVGIYTYMSNSWKKEPLFHESIKQIEEDWQAFRYGLDGTADISDEANR